MAKLFTDKKSTYGGPYAYYTVSVSQVSRTPASVKVKVTVTSHLQYYNSYLLTGKGYGLVAGIYLGGEWLTFTIKSESTAWRGTKKHTTSKTFSISAKASASSLSKIKFRVNRTSGGDSACKLNAVGCKSVSITDVSDKFSKVKINGSAVNQTKIRAALSGLPANTGYATEIVWYRGSKLSLTQKRSATTKETVADYEFKKCLPNTTYALKAIVKYNDTKLVTKAVNIVTPQETGKMTLSPKATYVTLSVSEMFNEPNYKRNVVIYYKKSSDKSYVKYATISEQGKSVKKNITKLLSNQKYDFKAEIRNDDTVLRTLTGSVNTLKDTSLIPTADIVSISQRLGTRLCTVSWITDKAVAGTTYEIQAYSSGAWTTLATLGSVSSPTVVISPDGNVDVRFRIISKNNAVADGVTNVSDEYTIYVRDDFVWDTPKTAGSAMVITANEWNRLREYVYAKNRNAVIPIVRAGEAITAESYNVMKNAISAVSVISIADKRTGDAITAADIDALRIAVNR